MMKKLLGFQEVRLLNIFHRRGLRLDRIFSIQLHFCKFGNQGFFQSIFLKNLSLCEDSRSAFLKDQPKRWLGWWLI